jgi:autotransporter passenger strand-loop-strand repeat protein
MTQYTVSSGHTSTGITLGLNDTMYVQSGGKAVKTTITSGGYLSISAGGSASGSKIGSSGREDDYGTDSGATVNNGGKLGVYGSATSATVNTGGIENIWSEGKDTGATLSGGTQNVNNGGTAIDTTVDNGGWQSDGYIASGTIINNGGSQTVSDSATSTTINDGGLQIVEGNAIATTVNNGGSQTILAGTATSTTVENGGVELLSGATAQASGTVLDGGTLQVDSGVILGTTINAAGSVVLGSDGSASGTTINAGGSDTVSGLEYAAQISGGTQTVVAGGTVSGSVVYAGGTLNISAGGTALGTINSGGTINDYGSMTLPVFQAGAEIIDTGGTATDPTLYGGTLTLDGGTVTDPTIDGGTFDLGTGTVNGPIQLNGNNTTLQIDGTTMPTPTIDISTSDTIFLADVEYDPTGTATLEANNELQVRENNETYNLDLNPGENFSDDNFQLVSYNGGTQIKLAATVTKGKYPPNSIMIGAHNDTLGGAATPFWHTYIFATDANGNVDFLVEGIPSKKSNGKGLIDDILSERDNGYVEADIKTGAAAATGGYTSSNDPYSVVFTGTAAEVQSKVATITNAANLFISKTTREPGAPSTHYQQLGPNCNTFQAYLAQTANLPEILPIDPSTGSIVFAPGVNAPMNDSWLSQQVGSLTDMIDWTLDNLANHDANGSDPTTNTIPNGQGVIWKLLGPHAIDEINKSVLDMSSNYLQQLNASGATTQDTAPLIKGIGAQAAQLTNLFLAAAGQVSPNMGGEAGGATLDGSQGNQLVIGFGGNNTLIGGGNDDLSGGLGANKFLFGQAALSAAQASTPATSTVLDFDQDGGSFSPSQGDTVDVSAIVGTAYSQGKTVGSLVRVIEDPSGSFANLEVNPTGSGAWTTIAQLEGLSLGDPVSVAAGTSGATSQIDVQVTGSTISPAFATAITPSLNEAKAGQAVTFTVTMNEAVAVSSVLPTLTLSDGGTATYDKSASKPASGTLVFDYTVGTSTPDLEVSSVSASGVTAVSGGAVADLSPIENAYTGLQVGAAFVTGVVATNYGAMSTDGDLLTGQKIEITVAMSEGVVVNTSKGSPFLTLNDGGTASYDPTASTPASGNLVFDYTPAAGDHSDALAVDMLNLNGATIVDSNGIAVDTSGAAAAVDFPILGMVSDSTTTDVNATIPTALTTSLSGEVGSGQTVQLTLQMSGAVSINSASGSPTLTLNDGATATYDAKLSNLGTGALVFDYTVGSGDTTSELSIAAVNLPTVTTVVDANGNPVDFSSVSDLTTNLQVNPAVVEDVVAGETAAHAGQTVALTVYLSEGVTLNAAGGNPTLTLSNNATATFDATASNLAAGTMVFDYTLGTAGQTANLTVKQVNLPSGTTVQDQNGVSVNFSAAVNAPLGLSVDTPLTVTGVTVPKGIVGIALQMSEGVTVNTVFGTPTLTLNDGSTATYDAAESTSTELVFNRDIEPYFQASNLAVTQVNLNGAVVEDANGYNADFSGALNVGTGIQETASVAVVSSVATDATFTENRSAVQLAPALSLTDTTSSTLNSVVVSVTTSSADGTTSPVYGDVLTANTAGTAITANYDDVDDILLLSGTDTLAHYQQVLRSVAFSTTSQNPAIGGIDQTRTVAWTVNENPNPSTTTVNIIPSAEILFRNDTSGDTGFYQIVNGALTGWYDVGASSPAYSAVGTGDFVGNGSNDILYRDNTTGDTGFYNFSNGANTGWSDIGASSTAYSIVGIGDFTGNGTDDILYRDNATGDTGFYTISNGVNTGWSDVGASSTAYSVVGVGDFTGSGTDDILYRDNANGDTGFYTMSNGVNTGWSDVGTSSTAYSVVGVGDFMGTGTDDILYRDNATGDTGFYAISNGVNTGWHDIGASSTAYSVVGVGDYLGSGNSDILYRNNTTGDTGFYAIVNGVNTGWHDIGVSSSAYHVVS